MSRGLTISLLVLTASVYLAACRTTVDTEDKTWDEFIGESFGVLMDAAAKDSATVGPKYDNGYLAGCYFVFGDTMQLDAWFPQAVHVGGYMWGEGLSAADYRDRVVDSIDVFRFK